MRSRGWQAKGRILVGSRPVTGRRRTPDAPAQPTEAAIAPLTERHFTGLLAVRSGIAAFERVSEREARLVGATHAQHHVLLSLRGHTDPAGPTVKDVAGALGVSSPSAVELIARMVSAGLLQRHSDPSDARVTRLRLTALGERLMHQLSEGHLPRLRELVARGVEHLRE